jgi:two-component system, OmpR family, sensor histidine kinase KdpD
MDEVVYTLERHFVEAFGLPLSILLKQGDQLTVQFRSPMLSLDEGDLATARLAVQCGRRVGRGTADLPDSPSSFVPLSTWEGPVGAIGFKGNSHHEWISPDEWPVVENFANQAALAVLRARLGEQAQRAAALSHADKLQKALLNSISHNVRTPLASIIGALSTLQEDECAHTLNEWTRRELVDTARAEAERLNHLLTNLLDMSRLEAGVLPIRLDPCDVEDVIGAALEQLGGITRQRSIQVDTARDLPFVQMDFVLIVQVLVNLLDNALKYSPESHPVAIRAQMAGEELELSVLDDGEGIPEQNLSSVFEKFNRGNRTGETGGIGLGLSICKGLVEAHGGKIWARRLHPHGTAVTFTIPCR